MKNKKLFLMIITLVIFAFAGCGNKTEQDVSNNSENIENTQDESEGLDDENNDETSSDVENTEDVDMNAEEENEEDLEDQLAKEEEEARKAEEERKLAEQRNSFSMMYYLAITAEEIRTSKDNRLALEDIYTSLLNDVNPGAVDEITQEHHRNLRDIIKTYLNISVKRERLQFIYNQEKAAAMRSSVPDPLAMLSVSNALDWKQLALSVAYTAVDSYNNYKSASEAADLAFIMSGWELDDEEKDAVMKNRDRAFDYMVDMVQEYKLDGLKTLNENSIKRFVEICTTENASERIKLLKADEETYELLGNYWLELAEAYFETSQYTKCLEAVEKYNSLATGIYRQDFNYLQILPKAIVAAQETYSGDEYIEIIDEFADAILVNTSTEDWSMRYFAAQVYLDLYSKTSDKAYLDDAYKIASENVTVLLKNQRTINNSYLNAIVEQTVEEPDYRYMTEKEKEEKEKEYKEEKKRVKEYNKALKEERKTELPSLYEPLIFNCELLFALSDQIDISESEKTEIENILETEKNGIFMVDSINDAYSFGNVDNKYSIEFSAKELVIPVNLMTKESKITVTVSEKGKSQTFDDFVVTKVERDGKTIDEFKAYVSSKQLKKYDWTANSKIDITITYSDACDKSITFKYVVKNFEKHWYGDKMEFVAQ